MKKRTLRSFLAVLLVTGASAPLWAQGATSYVSIGDSLASGYSSASLVETNQATSVPALIARQSSLADFQQPLVSEPGIPAQLALLGLLPVPTIGPKAATLGTPKNLNLARPYNNLAVPGATSLTALSVVDDPDNPYDNFILRGLGTQVAQAIALRPTFITLWIGNNDVLGAAIRGKAIDGVTLTPAAAFKQIYGQIVVALKATGASIVAANLPDVTTIPFVTTIKPYVVNPATGQPVVLNGQNIPLIGPAGPLPPSSFVTLPAASLLAQGIGIPAELGGTGQPLPDEVILDAGEVAIIRDHVDKDNAAIAEICAQNKIPVLDVHAVLQDFYTNGRDIGGVTLRSDFLTGGIFSYDGVHPSALGYAVVANEWIRVINENGGSVPAVDLAPFLGLGASSQGLRALGASRGAGLIFTPEAYASLLMAFPTLAR